MIAQVSGRVQLRLSGGTWHWVYVLAQGSYFAPEVEQDGTAAFDAGADEYVVLPCEGPTGEGEKHRVRLVEVAGRIEIEVEQDTTAEVATAERLTFLGTDGREFEFYLINPGFGVGYELDVFRTSINGVQDIATRLVTRGYRAMQNAELRGQNEHGGTRKWKRGGLVLGTWDPSVTVTARVDGVSEEKLIFAGRTKERTRYFAPYGKRAWDATNVNDDWETKYREDYSVMLPGGLGGTEPEDASEIWLGELGVNFEQHQEYAERFRVGLEGRWLQLVIENDRGRCEVRGVEVEAGAGRRRAGVIG